MSHIRFEIELWKLVIRSKFCKLTCRDELRIAACLPVSIDCYRDFQEYVVFLLSKGDINHVSMAKAAHIEVPWLRCSK